VPELLDGGDPPEAQGPGYVVHRSLANDQDMLVVVITEHFQRGVRHHHLVLVNIDPKPTAQFVRLIFSECVAGVGDKDSGHFEVPVVIYQPLESVRGEGQDVLAPDDDTVNVEEYPEVGRGTPAHLPQPWEPFLAVVLGDASFLVI